MSHQQAARTECSCQLPATDQICKFRFERVPMGPQMVFEIPRARSFPQYKTGLRV
jgi:hypothetical protein